MRYLRGNLFNPSTYRIHPAHRLAPAKIRPRQLPEANIRPDAVCITTNGFVKRNGQAVMGRGCAKTAAERWPDLPRLLGRAIGTHGNKVILFDSIGTTDWSIISFPVKCRADLCRPDKSNVVRHMQKAFQPNETVPGWACVASIDIIATSARQLVRLANDRGFERIVLPRPGCGAGELEWKNVKEVLSKFLDDRFYCITF